MTSAGPRSGETRKMEPPSPETYDPTVDAYRSWLLAIDALHDLMVIALVADHEMSCVDSALSDERYSDTGRQASGPAFKDT
jgi:hypothetical protein